MPSEVKKVPSHITPSSRAASRARMHEYAAAAAAKNAMESENGHHARLNHDSSSRSATSHPVQIPRENDNVLSKPVPASSFFPEMAQKEHLPSQAQGSTPDFPIAPRHHTQMPRHRQLSGPQSHSQVPRLPSAKSDAMREERVSDRGKHLGRGKTVSRTKVRLYSDEGSNQIRDFPMDYDSDMTLDSPYVPGPSSTNKLRCLKWLRNVPKNVNNRHRAHEYDMDVDYTYKRD